MNRMTRRSALKHGLAWAGLLSTPNLIVRPASADVVTRHDVASPEGLAMLKILAAAVAKMVTLPESDPRNWQFQWYTHSVRSDRTKASEINRIYKTASDPNRPTAQAMWDTCEAHRDSSRENFFLPWHRLYVLQFEDIIRKISSEPKFTLPYWNYTDAGSRALPVQFRQQNDTTWKSLYRVSRNPGANAGTPIDKVPNAVPINLNAMKSPLYQETEADAGFCANLDNAPHGSVHVDVGNDRGMGQVPWAANDPIFWLHHCNIDRIWASWNKAGGKNPNDQNFKDEPFTFADGSGAKAIRHTGEALQTDGYVYDNYLPRPPGSAPFPTPGALVEPGTLLRRATANEVSLGRGPTIVKLLLRATGALVNPDEQSTLSSDFQGNPERPVFLKLQNVRVPTEPSTSYDVFLNASGNLDRADASYVGSLSLFGAGSHASHVDQPGTGHAMGRNFSFVITDQIQRLRDADRLNSVPTVTLKPVGELHGGATPIIGSISLIS